MGRSKQSKYTDIVLETYSKLFDASEPKFDFMNYINTTCNYIKRDTNEKVVTEEHLSVDDMHLQGLSIDVPFEEHFIDKYVSERIIKEQVKKYKLNKAEEEKLRYQVYLGCGPAFKKDQNLWD